MLPPRAPQVLVHRHCSLCGGRLAPEIVEGRERPRCPDCGFVFYVNPAPAAAGVVVDSAGRVLLIRRAIEPFKGSWALPAGYQDLGEEPARAAEREVLEETGLAVEACALFDLLFFPEGPRRPANLAVFLCRVVGGALQPGDDALEARFFGLDELPPDIGFDNAARILARLPGSASYRRLLQAPDLEGAPPAARERSAPMDSDSPRLTYKDAGVDIDRKYAAVERAAAAIKHSFTPGVVGEFGSFGGLYDLGRAGVGRGLLVASADGVGTKLEIAKRARVYDTVGRDLVQHCINDILVQGARPLFFMDYVAAGVLDPEVVSALIRGCAEGCRANGLALLGGETAEMPGLYAPGDFDLAGFIVGIVDPEALLDGSRTRPGQIVLGLDSAGLHTNGYSLARKIVFDVLGLSLDDRPAELGGRSLGEALLAEHRSYFSLLWPLLEERRIAALAHVTGGGIPDNLPRVLGGCDALIERASWKVPPLFALLCRAGELADEEAYRVFNMGIGMVLLVEPEEAEVVEQRLARQGERVHRIGRVVPRGSTAGAEGDPGGGTVRWA